MHIEDTLAAILTELRGIRSDINRPIRADAVIAGANAIAAAHPQSPVVPSPPLQVSAPSIAAVPPPPTAPAAPTDSSPAPTTVFAQAAATSVAPGTLAAPPMVPPAPPVDPTVSPFKGVELDSKGMPWDGRIHASSKAKIADGTWRAKRGVEPELVTKVEAELRGAQAAPGPASAFAPHPFGEGTPSGAPAAPVGPSRYTLLMSRLPQHMAAGDIKPDQVTAACIMVGVQSIAALATRDDLVDSVAQQLGIAL